jgi:hypothetical protein
LQERLAGQPDSALSLADILAYFLADTNRDISFLCPAYVRPPILSVVKVGSRAEETKKLRAVAARSEMTCSRRQAVLGWPPVAFSQSPAYFPRHDFRPHSPAIILSTNSKRFVKRLDYTSLSTYNTLFIVPLRRTLIVTPFFTEREVAEIIGTTQARISYAIKAGRYRPPYYRERSHRFLMREDVVALAKLFRLPVPVGMLTKE